LIAIHDARAIAPPRPPYFAIHQDATAAQISLMITSVAARLMLEADWLFLDDALLIALHYLVSTLLFRRC